MSISLKIVERTRKSVIWTDPHASDAIPLWHFFLDLQEDHWGQGEPRAGAASLQEQSQDTDEKWQAQFLWAMEQYIYI